MKKVLTIMVVVLIPAMTMAENPDSRLSLTMYGGIGSGTWKTKYLYDINVYSEFDIEQSTYGAEFRWPQTQDITFIFNIQLDKQNYGGGDILEGKHEYVGTDFHVAIKLYFGESVNK